MINPPFAAVAVSPLSKQRVIAVLGDNPQEIKEYFCPTLFSDQESARPLAPMTLLKVRFGQPVAIDAMINHSFGRVADRNPRANQSPGEVNILLGA